MHDPIGPRKRRPGESPEGVCMDTTRGSRGRSGAGCVKLAGVRAAMCNGDDDSSSTAGSDDGQPKPFNAKAMCCRCGGGQQVAYGQCL